MPERRIKNPPEESLASLARAASKPGGSSINAGTPRAVRRDGPNQRAVPGWYRVVAPLLFSMGGVLMVIGIWAVGAVLYMQRVTPVAPDDIQYPLLQWSDAVGNSGGYAPESRLMAYAMLACIPVAVAMAAIVLVLRRQMRARR